jgi:hypothetical protein
MKDRNRTQMDVGNYPDLGCSKATWKAVSRKCLSECNITIQDAAWLYGLARILWRPAKPTSSDTEEHAVTAWILAHKIDWAQRFGNVIADRLQAHIKAALKSGKLKYVGMQNAESILADLEKECGRKADQNGSKPNGSRREDQNEL